MPSKLFFCYTAPKEKGPIIAMHVYRKQRYRAIVLALIIHAVLWFVLFVVVLYKYQQATTADGRLGVSQSGVDTLFSDMPEAIAQAVESIVAPLVSAVPAEEELVSTTAADDETENESSVEEQDKELTQKDILQIAHSTDMPLIPVTTPDAMENRVFSQDQPPNRLVVPKKRKRKSSKFPPGVFAQLAQKYVEQYGSANGSSSLRSDIGDGIFVDVKGVPHRKSDQQSRSQDKRYAHVEDELAKMTLYSYMSGVSKGLKTAFALTRESVYFEEDLEECHTVEFTIGPDGSVKDAQIVLSFGKHDFDDYVIRTIKSYQFSPIPKQLKTTHIVKRVDARVRARAGRNQFELIIQY